MLILCRPVILILAHGLLLCLSLQLLPLPSGGDSTPDFTGSPPRPRLVSTPPGCPLTVTLWYLLHSRHQHCPAQQGLEGSLEQAACAHSSPMTLPHSVPEAEVPGITGRLHGTWILYNTY